MKLTSSLFLPLAILPIGCATQEQPLGGIVVQPVARDTGSASMATDGVGWLAVDVPRNSDSVLVPTTESPPSLRIKLGDQFLVWDQPDGPVYARVGGPHDAEQVATELPVGSYDVSLVDDQDRVWYQARALAVTDPPSFTHVLAWARDTGWTYSPPATDSDPATLQMTVHSLLPYPVDLYACTPSGNTALGITVPAGGDAIVPLHQGDPGGICAQATGSSDADMVQLVLDYDAFLAYVPNPPDFALELIAITPASSHQFYVP